MELNDTYKTIVKPSEALFKEKGSKFFSYLFPISQEQEVATHLDAIKEKHPKARHYCTAFKIGHEGEVFRTNDDGEPSGTAGKPMLNALHSAEITNVFALVVRYFGGTLLGASGLIQAYRTSVEWAIAENTIVEKTINQKFKIRFGFEDMGTVMNQVKVLGITVLNQDFDGHNILYCEARLSLIPKLQQSLTDNYKVTFEF